MTIFRILTFSYLLIFSLVIGMVLYAVFQFRQLNLIAGEVQKVDRRILDYGEKLTDILLSEVRYEKKFVITRAPVHLEQFAQFTKDFEEYFHTLAATAKYGELQENLVRIREFHKLYQHLFAEEVHYLKSNRDYAQSRYQREKEKAVATAMEGLEQITFFAQKNITARLHQIESATGKARTVSLALTGFFLLLGIVISFLITRSITYPIALLKEKTKRIAEGNLTGDVDLPAIPEVRELAETFNVMCEKLRNLDRMKSEFFFSMSKELCNPMTSIKERIDLLANELDQILSPDQKMKVAVLREESAHLLSVVNSMVEESKVESGTLQFETTALASLIDPILKDVSPLAEAKEIALKNEGCHSLPNIKVDAVKINQVLRTLIGNTLKLTAGRGAVTVSGKKIDQGIQISIARSEGEEAQEKLPPCPLPGASLGSNGDNATDLDLAMAKHVINAHGGRLWVETNSQQGHTVSFILPS